MINIHGTLQDLLAAGQSTASLQVTLCGFNGVVPRVAGTSLLAQTSVNVIPDNTGAFSFSVYGNDVITPGPNTTWYTISFLTSDGKAIVTVGYQFTGGGSQDLSNIAPFNVDAGGAVVAPPVAHAIVDNPTGQQTINTFPLSAAFIGSFIGTLGVNAVASGATPAFDLSKGSLQKHTMTSNITPTFSNLQEGQPVILSLKQDATGGRTVTWPANVVNGTQPDPTPNAKSVQAYIVLDGVLTPFGPMTVN